jgi:thioredoxin 1
MTKPVVVTDATFAREVLQSDVPVINDFWAERCGPCKMIAPILEEIAGDYEGQLKITKLDVDTNPETMTAFGIMSIPTLIMFKGGQEVERWVGAMPKSRLVSKIKPHLKEGAV